jgi:hypothetical protein
VPCGGGGGGGAWCGYREALAQASCGQPVQTGVARLATMLGFNFSKQVKQIQFQKLNSLKLSPDEKDLPELEKFEIKHGWEGFWERNNFLHRNISRIEIDFR